VGLAGGGEDRDLVVGGVEADVAARDVVDDDRVQALARELLSSSPSPFLSLPATGLAGRKSTTAAAISRTSAVAKTAPQASWSSCAVSTST
jgi:hypothetical protein